MATNNNRRRRYWWRNLSDDRLLDLRLSNLDLVIGKTWLKGCIDKLYEELEARGQRLRPHVWLSDEWFSPEGVPGIAVPFYLAHPRLVRLERNQMLEVEGGTVSECMRILRHEAGHAFQHAYRLNRRRQWQRLFGKSSRKYPDFYRPNPTSKRFVQHLRLWYAQSHPDEDFAETFAVWLRPRSDWRRRYIGWPALRKLQYVDELMLEIGDQVPQVRARSHVFPVRRMKKTLGEHYQERRARYEVGWPDIWDQDLKILFSDGSRRPSAERASTFLRRNRTEIRRMVSKWTGEYQSTLDTILEEMIGRCRELRLRAVGPRAKLRMDFAVLVTVKTMHYLYSHGRREWIPL
jgi:hypothetical protein